ncbi:MAG: molybdopterin-dependent oxidoreductase [candidate division NC10 bacterium]|nr:molybdopterin-dependent oxidoreductase [candidate division NC10 bacterium]
MEIRTMCPMNCHPTYCGMVVEVKDGKVVGVRGDHENPDSRGFLCVRGLSAPAIIGNSLRILHPLRRKGPRGSDTWERISWDDALGEIASRMQAAGREAVALWPGHGALTNTIGGHAVRRFGNVYGCQYWNPAIICWALGAFGLHLTGTLEINTKEDMGEQSRLILFWGANLASQPTIAPHLIEAKRRGATVITIDVRETEAALHSDRFIPIRPSTDAALALSMMHVSIEEGLYDQAFVEKHTVGFDRLREHVRQYDPEWAAAMTGIPADQIRDLSHLYATRKPGMIVLGGASMYKSQQGWLASRAISCLPALTGQYGVPGGGLGQRHRGVTHGEPLYFENLYGEHLRPPGTYIPSHMPTMLQAFEEGRIQVLFLFGTNMLSSFSDSHRTEKALDRVWTIVVHDLFMNETARRMADFVLPGTTWVEETGFKTTNTHLYLMPQVIEPLGEARSVVGVLRALADHLGIGESYWPWPNEEGALDVVFAHPSIGLSTAKLRVQGGIVPLRVSPVAYPERRFQTPSGKVEFYSERAASWGLPPMPVHEEPLESPIRRPDLANVYPLVLRNGRTLTHFHAFYLSGQAIPALAKLDPEPVLWLHPHDANARGIQPDTWVRCFNDRGELRARALVTEKIQPGVAWIRDGWPDVNRLTSSAPSLPVELTRVLSPPNGQAAYEALVEVAPLER